MTKTISTVLNPEDSLKLEKAAKMKGLTIVQAVRYIAEHGPKAFLMLPNSGH